MRFTVLYQWWWRRKNEGLPALLLVRLLSGGLAGLPAIFLDGLTPILPRTASHAHAR
jgi:hypothetical protein